MVDVSVRVPWSIGPLLIRISKDLVIFQAKTDCWGRLFARLYSEERPQFVILDRNKANKPHYSPDQTLRYVYPTLIAPDNPLIITLL